MDAQRVIADLRELAELTSTADGAQRVAWGPVWRRAREWYRGKIAELGLAVETDSAGNNWVRLPGKRPEAVVVAGHLDSVPNGGWLDGVLGSLTGLGVLRAAKAKGLPPVSLLLVDWADEEGARFGRSLVGSSAAGGSLQPQKELGHLKDRAGISMVEALRENGVELDRMLEAHREMMNRRPRAYLELHIEQGPVLESMKRPTGVVLGTFGVERHMFRFTGQAAHSGSTPIPNRRDAFLAAAEFALACRKIGLAMSGKTPEKRVVSTCGVVKVEPCIVTAVPGSCEISLDQRALQAKVLQRMFRSAEKAARAAAKRNHVKVVRETLWRIEPRPFDKKLIRLCEEAVKEITGTAPRLPSGPLHDAAEMVPHMPTSMMFAYSARGLSHCKEEDTPTAHLEKTIRSFGRWAEKTIESL